MKYTKEEIITAAKYTAIGEGLLNDLFERIDELRMERQQNIGKPIVSLSLPPSEAAIKDALLIGYVAGYSTQVDIAENVLWENYKKYCLKPNKVPDDGGGNDR